MIWMMGILNIFADYTRREGMKDTPEGHAAFQRDLSRNAKDTNR